MDSFSNKIVVNKYPINTTCPACKKDIVTSVRMETSIIAHVMAGVLCFMWYDRYSGNVTSFFKKKSLAAALVLWYPIVSTHLNQPYIHAQIVERISEHMILRTAWDITLELVDVGGTGRFNNKLIRIYFESLCLDC